VTRCRVLSWDGIPAQVKVYEPGRRPLSAEMPKWFVEHIDREAMRRGLLGSDEYLEQWSWTEVGEREGDAEEVAAQLVAELEAEWEPTRQEWLRSDPPGRPPRADGGDTDQAPPRTGEGPA
jgi:Virulence factor